MEGTITQLGLKNYLINTSAKKQSFFAHSYQNYANFAKDTRALNFLADVDFGKRISFRFDQNGRYGDLITNIVLQVTVPSLAGKTVTKTGGGTSQVGYTNGLGNALIREVQLKIGGNIIDTQTSEFMDIWSSFSLPAGKQSVYAKQIKKYPTQSPFNNQTGGTLYIPFFFWFCQNTNANLRNNNALAMPLIGMRNAEIELIVEFRRLDELVIYQPGANATLANTYPGASDLKISSHNLLVDYVTLEAEERIRYLEAMRQMYLISQTQIQTFPYSAGTTAFNLNLREFKYPITELIWIIRTNDNKDENNYFNYTNSYVGDPNNATYLDTAKLTFDGRDRIPELDGAYFTDVEPFKVHDSINAGAQIHTYSFALEPENLAQPTGSCNFSGIHEPRFQFKLKPGTPAGEIIVIGMNYNVLQVDNKGNVWLLHNLSKNSPDQIPDPNAYASINVCNLTVDAERSAKDLIAKINKMNIYRDPRQVESGLANRILAYKRKNNVTQAEEFMPLLDALHDELDKLNIQLSRGIKKITLESSGVRTLNVGGNIISVDDIDALLANLSPK